MQKNELKRIIPYVVAVAVFVAIAVAYCLPLLEGKVLSTSDVKAWEGAAQEAREFKKATGETSWWTNSMFGGMPTYQITGSMPSTWFVQEVIRPILNLGFSGVLGLIIGYFIGFFILMRCFGVNKWLSIVGSVALTFSTYFFIILAAGHMTKAATLGFMAPVIGGFYLIFRQKYWIGFPLVTLYATVGAFFHPQMSYYIFMLLGICVLAELYTHIKERRLRDFGIAVAVLAMALALSGGTRYAWYSAQQEYLTETMRGGHSELHQKSETDSSMKGLEIGYATAWSYGIEETLTLLIPNMMGGSSHYTLGESSNVYTTMVKQGVPQKSAQEFCQNLPMYWGNQPFTSGPVYVGAIVCFLFILGLIILRGPYKWAMLVATLFSIALSWGSNFMWLTQLFFDYFPMYNKFRAVSSILIVVEITMPLIAFLALQEIIKGRHSKADLLKAIYWAGGTTLSLCLFVALFSKLFFSFTSANDAAIFSQLPDWLSDAIVEERRSMFVADALRSACFIALAGGVVWLYIQNRLKFAYFVLILGVLVLADMVPVNRRFFNNDNFVAKSADRRYFAIQPYEQKILEDKSLHFRVLNTATNTFNDARTSYRLSSVGGYSAVKLRRYQDIIDAHISQNNMAVVNMLNTKYIVLRGAEGQAVPQLNPGAMGNAWFVDSLLVVNTPYEESEALRILNLQRVAVTDRQFEQFAKQLSTPIDEQATIELTHYAPNALTYKSSSTVAKTAVFSEVYYPYGWKAYIDGVEQEHFRVNYLLRALHIPQGEHTILFEFKPDSIYKKDRVSVAILVTAGVLCLLALGYPMVRKRRKEEASVSGD